MVLPNIAQDRPAKRAVPKSVKPRGRPRGFDEAEALTKIERQLWTAGLSGSSVHAIARAGDLCRPSLTAAFGTKDAIYARVATDYLAVVDKQLSEALDETDLETALTRCFETAIRIYTSDGPDGCFVICTAPAEAETTPVCREMLDQAVERFDALFFRRLERAARGGGNTDLPVLAALLGAALNSIALRARAGWSRDRLEWLAAGAIRQAVLSLSGN
ncbi:MAG: TetR family transcriptional regulator [Bradyrhizobium sp.]|nr:TetR family transcriptional regulator [Bradyrhizobium sp.]